GIVGLLADLYGLTAGPAHPLATRLLVAAPVALFVVGLIVLLRRRLDRLPLAGIGFTGPAAGLRGFLQGAGIVLASGSVVLLALVLFGAASVSDLNAGALLGFLFTNAIVAILFEAIPEETAIRGYALTSLRRRFGPLLAGAL